MNLGIIGGVGPIAGLDLFNRILLKSNAICDNEYLPMILYSDSKKIASRTESFFQNNIKPAKDIIDIIKQLQIFHITHVVIVCNTIHIPLFFDKICDFCSNNNIKVYSLVDIVEEYIVKNNCVDKYLLLSTRATFQSRIYHNILTKSQKTIINISKNDLLKIDKIIKNFKGNINDYAKYYKEIFNIINKYNYENIILGCTELSYIFFKLGIDYYIDPIELLSNKILAEYE